MLLTLFLYVAHISILTAGVNGLNENHYRRKKPATKMFVFGDSYADTGNIPKPLANSWKAPYGITFPGHPSGRFSDGKMLTDYIAKFLGFTSPISSSMRKVYPHKARHGMNFACGGTGVLNTIATMKLGLPNMTSQIDLFQNMLRGNDVVHIDANLNDSIAFVSLVGNDYNTYLSMGGSKKDMPSFIVKVVSQLGVELERIMRLGVGKIVVTGLQPLGCMPQTTARSSFKQCNADDNSAVQLHNHLLQQAVDKLNNSQSPIFILDLFNSFINVFKENHGPSGKLRFKDPLKPCCIPSNNVDGSCSDVDKDGKKMYRLCDNPSTTFFWDSYHPTEAGWRAVFAHLKPNLQQAL